MQFDRVRLSSATNQVRHISCHDFHTTMEYAQFPPAAAGSRLRRLWLKNRRKTAQHKAISALTAEHAGSPLDLDGDLEAASIEHLLTTDEGKR
jgi:hypothetical protein